MLLCIRDAPAWLGTWTLAYCQSATSLCQAARPMRAGLCVLVRTSLINSQFILGTTLTRTLSMPSCRSNRHGQHGPGGDTEDVLQQLTDYLAPCVCLSKCIWWRIQALSYPLISCAPAYAHAIFCRVSQLPTSAVILLPGVAQRIGSVLIPQHHALPVNVKLIIALLNIPPRLCSQTPLLIGHAYR